MRSPIADGWVSSEYGRRGSGIHAGIDLRARAGYGTPVAAAFAGVVEKVVSGRGHGNTSRRNELAPYRTGDGVIVRNPDGERQLYGHVAPAVRVGQRVAEGQLLGVINDSGNTSGPHVHYEEWTASGYTRNPRVSFRVFGVTPGKGLSPPKPAPSPGLSIPGVTSSTYPNVRVAANAAALDKAWATFLFAYGFRQRYTKDRMRRWLLHWKSLSGYTGPTGTAKAHDEAQVRGMQRLLRNVSPRWYSGDIDGDRGPMTLAAEAGYLNSYADDVRAIMKG